MQTISLESAVSAHSLPARHAPAPVHGGGTCRHPWEVWLLHCRLRAGGCRAKEGMQHTPDSGTVDWFVVVCGDYVNVCPIATILYTCVYAIGFPLKMEVHLHNSIHTVYPFRGVCRDYPCHHVVCTKLPAWLFSHLITYFIQDVYIYKESWVIPIFSHTCIVIHITSYDSSKGILIMWLPYHVSRHVRHPLFTWWEPSLDSAHSYAPIATYMSLCFSVF